MAGHAKLVGAEWSVWECATTTQWEWIWELELQSGGGLYEN